MRALFAIIIFLLILHFVLDAFFIKVYNHFGYDMLVLDRQTHSKGIGIMYRDRKYELVDFGSDVLNGFNQAKLNDKIDALFQ